MVDKLEEPAPPGANTFKTLSEALAKWRADQQALGPEPADPAAQETWRVATERLRAAVIEIVDSAAYSEQLAIRLEQGESLQIRAPFDGFVTLRANMMAFGGVYFGGAMPEYRVGDATNSGQLIADLIDTSSIEMTAKLPEHDRAHVNPGQAVNVSVDAIPEATLEGTVRAVSGVANRQVFEGGGVRRFDIAFDVRGNLSRVRPGVSAALAILAKTERRQ